LISIHRIVATIGTVLLSAACNEIADIREPILDLSVGGSGTGGSGTGSSGTSSGGTGNSGTPDVVEQISAGDDHTCAVLDTGKVKCWGSDYYGQIGLGEQGFQGMGLKLPPVNLGSGEVASLVKAGDSHTCALLQGGRLKCWGANERGQLGLGNTLPRGKLNSDMGNNLPVVNVGMDKQVKDVDLGFEHTCVLLTDAKVKCWGNNSSGALGTGNTTDLGTKMSQMGDNLPIVDLGPDYHAQAIAAGLQHTCALLEDGSVKCWGNNMRGQLGQGDTLQRGSDQGQMGSALLPVDLGAKAKAISAGYNTSCALLMDDHVKCWGDNMYGQLGQGDADERGDVAGQMGINLLPVDLGPAKTAKAIRAAGQHSCAWLSDDSVKCWGRNDSGQLGQGNSTTLGDDPLEMGIELPPISLGTDQPLEQIDSGSFHSCILRMDGRVKCWGLNFSGQLGYPLEYYSVGGAPGEMGDNLPTLDLVSPK